MSKIMSVSSLRNYGPVLDEVAPGNPVFLTKNGAGRYVIVDTDEYDFLHATACRQFFEQLDAFRAEAKREGWTDLKDARARYRKASDA